MGIGSPPLIQQAPQSVSSTSFILIFIGSIAISKLLVSGMSKKVVHVLFAFA